MNDTHHIPTSANLVWGFYGCLQEQAAAAWPIAMAAIHEATGEPLEAVRAFLDSRQGRHFGDEVQNGLFRGLALPAAIDAATQQWMTWRISRRASREYGIPVGLPYLVGWVVDAAIQEEIAA